MRARPEKICSTRCFSAVCGSVAVSMGFLSTASLRTARIVRNFLSWRRRVHRRDSIRHHVKNNVDAQRIGPLFRELTEKIFVLAFALPTIAVVCVVRGDHHDPALIVQDGPHVHLGALFAIMVFPGYPGVLAVFSRSVVGGLQFVLRSL